jgi:hypothetical protein
MTFLPGKLMRSIEQDSYQMPLIFVVPRRSDCGVLAQSVADDVSVAVFKKCEVLFVFLLEGLAAALATVLGHIMDVGFQLRPRQIVVFAIVA